MPFKIWKATPPTPNFDAIKQMKHYKETLEILGKAIATKRVGTCVFHHMSIANPNVKNKYRK